MAFVGTPPELAIAVCQAGGIGSIGVGLLPAEVVTQLVSAVRKATETPFHIDFITPLTKEDQIDACVSAGAPIVSFHWGHPSKAIIDRLHTAGVKVWEQVGSVESARRAVGDGVDLVVAQGIEAGGHNFSTLPTFVLVPAIAEAITPCLLLAAGGVATGRQLAAALALGADGVWVGTRFVASEEAFAHSRYKQQLVAANCDQTRLTSIYGPDHPDFNPMRVLDIGLAREYAGREDLAPRDLGSQPVVAKMNLAGQEIPLQRFSSFLPTPTTTGEVDELAFPAGQAVGFVQDIRPAREIIIEMVDEARAVLNALLANR